MTSAKDYNGLQIKSIKFVADIFGSHSHCQAGFSLNVLRIGDLCVVLASFKSDRVSMAGIIVGGLAWGGVHVLCVPGW